MHNESVKKRISRSCFGSKNHNAVAVVCVETQEKFDCIADAARFYNIDDSHIAKCCKGKRNVVGGLHWQYATTERTEEKMTNFNEHQEVKRGRGRPKKDNNTKKRLKITCKSNFPELKEHLVGSAVTAEMLARILNLSATTIRDHTRDGILHVFAKEGSYNLYDYKTAYDAEYEHFCALEEKRRKLAIERPREGCSWVKKEDKEGIEGVENPPVAVDEFNTLVLVEISETLKAILALLQ